MLHLNMLPVSPRQVTACNFLCQPYAKHLVKLTVEVSRIYVQSIAHTLCAARKPDAPSPNRLQPAATACSGLQPFCGRRGCCGPPPKKPTVCETSSSIKQAALAAGVHGQPGPHGLQAAAACQRHHALAGCADVNSTSHVALLCR